jgi:hypothetical protein
MEGVKTQDHQIEDTIYMTYVAYDGCSPPRVALTSISVEAFLKRRWIWKNRYSYRGRYNQ